MGVPSTAHLIYIPVILAIGFAIGWTIAGRSIRAELDRQQVLEEKRAQRRAERRARKAAASEGEETSP